MRRSPSSCGSVFTNCVPAPGWSEFRMPVSIARHAGLMTASPPLPVGCRQACDRRNDAAIGDVSSSVWKVKSDRTRRTD